MFDWLFYGIDTKKIQQLRKKTPRELNQKILPSWTFWKKIHLSDEELDALYQDIPHTLKRLDNIPSVFGKNIPQKNLKDKREELKHFLEAKTQYNLDFLSKGQNKQILKTILLDQQYSKQLEKYLQDEKKVLISTDGNLNLDNIKTAIKRKKDLLTLLQKKTILDYSDNLNLLKEKYPKTKQIIENQLLLIIDYIKSIKKLETLNSLIGETIKPLITKQIITKDQIQILKENIMECYKKLDANQKLNPQNLKKLKGIISFREQNQFKQLQILIDRNLGQDSVTGGGGGHTL